ncbi:MAG: thymidine phosphorylase [Chloroflexota bacterium]
MSPAELIARKRDGQTHTREEIEFLVGGIASGAVPDYQAAAWLMAVCIRGMTPDETDWLTEAMAASGEMLDMQARWPNVVDKHSTGGVGDKTTLVLMPALAACGCRVAKMSGRGLGFSGGTIDKLESIPGLRTDLSRQEFLDQVERIGIAIASQSADLAPADGKMYALRDVTATVDSIPLIASSIMSKKLACRAGRLVLDVKVGSGAFMKTLEHGRALAKAMVSIGQAAGVQTAAVISDMSQPEGCAIGNALEVREAIETLRGHGPADVLELCSALAEALGVAGVGDAIRSGGALEQLRMMVEAQGGDVRVLDEPERLPQARLRRDLPAARSGWLGSIDAEFLGRAAVALGAGRFRKDDPVDPAVGFVLRAKIGDRVEAGQPLLEVHANDQNRLDQAFDSLAAAYRVSERPAKVPGLVKAIIPAS